MQLFPNLPDSARVWILPLTSTVTEQAQKQILKTLEQFVHTWVAHEEPVHGDAAVLFGRFIVIAADGVKTNISGCSIDSAFRAGREAAAAVGLEVADRGLLFFKGEKGVEATSEKRVSDETLIYQTGLQNLGEVRNSFEVPFSGSRRGRIIAREAEGPDSGN